MDPSSIRCQHRRIHHALNHSRPPTPRHSFQRPSPRQAHGRVRQQRLRDLPLLREDRLLPREPLDRLLLLLVRLLHLGPPADRGRCEARRRRLVRRQAGARLGHRGGGRGRHTCDCGFLLFGTVLCCVLAY